MEEHFAVSDCEKQWQWQWQWHRHWREQSTRYVKGMVFAFVLLFLGLFATPGFAEHEVSNSTAILSWNANADDHTGYKVYVGTESGIYSAGIDVLNVLTFSVVDLTVGTHYFVLTAYDAAGNESLFSEEVSKTVSILPGDHTPPDAPTNLQIAGEMALSIRHSSNALVMFIKKSGLKVE